MWRWCWELVPWQLSVLDPGHRLCMWKDRTWQKYSFLLLFILRLFLASRDTQRQTVAIHFVFFPSWIYLWIWLKQIPRTKLLRMLTPKVVNFTVILQVLFYRINTNWLFSFFFLKEYVFSNFLLHCIYPFANITITSGSLTYCLLSNMQNWGHFRWNAEWSKLCITEVQTRIFSAIANFLFYILLSENVQG